MNDQSHRPEDRPRDSEQSRGAEGVPETWRGYLGEEEPSGRGAATGLDSADSKAASAGTRRDDGGNLSEEQRDWLRRSLDGDDSTNPPRTGSRRQDVADAWTGTARDGRPLDERGVPRSRAEGVSLGGLVPFFLFLIVGVALAAWLIWSTAKPIPYSTAGFGAPDKPPAVVVRDFFSELIAGNSAAELFVDDFALLRIDEVDRGAPFDEGIHRRQARAAGLARDGRFQAIDTEPQLVADSGALLTLEYEWADLTTGQTEKVMLWLARVEEGWRIVGFG
jgi:hypothetical protein